jgi:glycosyltransferase involved in cell wall biosynthesis
MVARKRILIPLNASFKTSAAIVIYISNLIKGLSLLADNKKPEIFLFHNDIAPIDFIQEINYPYISFYNSKKNNNIPKRIINHFAYKYLNKYIFKTFPYQVDIVFPSYTNNSCFDSKKFIHWKADFQEKYLPEYFTPDDLKYTEYFFKNLKKHPKDTLVLSSYDAANDFKKFYPSHINPTHILRFVSFLPPYDHLDLNVLKSKFKIIEDKYFIVCNQFWPHKNHIRILESLNLLIEKNIKIDFQIVLTGATSSHRSNAVYDVLKNYINQHQLEKHIVITGFLQREEQLKLMKGAQAIIQPTYFEGWSTVIEDAKAMSQFVIASNINVNQEQINEHVCFFNPNDSQELANILEKFKPQILKDLDYQNDLNAYSKSLEKLFEL